MLILLKDICENKVTAIIESQTTTADKIQTIIGRIKKIENYNCEDLTAALPKDCTIKWFNNDVDGEAFW